MSRPSEPPSTPSQHTVVHYHYHYYYDTPPNLYQTERNLRKIRSDESLKLPHNYVNNSETDSNSSRQSWKRLVKPQLQSTLSTPFRSSESASFFKLNSKLDKTSANSPFRATASDFAVNTPKGLGRKDRSISSNLNLTMENSPETGSPLAQFTAKSGQSGWSSPSNKTQMTKSRFSKKGQIQISSASRLRELTEREAGIWRGEEERSYRQALLEEQCRYLRQQFMAHIEQRHPLQFE